MNIIFLGSSGFAVPALKALLRAKHKIACVVTQPDRKKGRGLHVEGTPVKQAALEAGLQIFQPQKINTPEAIEFLKKFSPDLFVVIAYGQILEKSVLAIPKIFCINAHASVLPRYRGAAPISWAIINGEDSTGVSIMKLDESMDTGPVIRSKEIKINDDDTVISLEQRLSELAAELVIDSLTLIDENRYQLIPQDESKATFAPKLKKQDGLIDWKKQAIQIHNLIRGCLAWPGAFTYYNGKLIKIYKARGVTRATGQQGTIKPGEVAEVSKNGILILTGKDYLCIDELQPEGKKKMSVEEFIAGHEVVAGSRLGA